MKQVTLGILSLLLVAGMAVQSVAAEPPLKEQLSPKIAPGKADILSPNPTSGPITRGQRYFSVGHSMLAGFFCPCLDEMAREAGYKDHACAGVSRIGRSKVIQHFGNKDLQAALNAGTVDVLTTAGVYLPDPGVEKFAELGVAHNPNFRLTFLEMWLPFDKYDPVGFANSVSQADVGPVDHNAATGESLRESHKPYFDDWDNEIIRVNKKLGKQAVFVVPAGQAAIALREKIIAGKAPGLKQQEDLFADKAHPLPPLAVLMTYCHYAVIYRKSPVGLPVPRALRIPRIDAKDLQALNRLLQELAWDAVIHHPLSGVTANPEAVAH